MIEILAGLVTLIFGLYIYLTWNFDYWKKLGVPYDKPVILTGSLSDVILGKQHISEHQKSLYRKFEGHPFAGFFLLRQPTLLIRDPELVKAIIVKDFDYFIDRTFHPDEDTDPLAGRNLFGMRGIKWRYLRNKLSPTFTSGKMKMMFPLVAACSEELGELLLKHAKKGEIVELKDIAARYTTDVIATCAFGIQCHSLKNPNAEFREIGRKIFAPNFRNQFVLTGVFFFPQLIKFFRLKAIPPDVEVFFRSVLSDTMGFREKNNVQRPDFLQLLLQIKNKGKVDDDDDEEEEGNRIEVQNSKTSIVNGKYSESYFIFFISREKHYVDLSTDTTSLIFFSNTCAKFLNILKHPFRF